MASGNQLVSRITQQRRNTQGMLSPGRKNGPGRINAPLSPVAADFAGRKFQLAAKKMRILGEDRVRSLLPRTEMTLSADVANKFKDIERIIHINPKTIRDGSIWSEVEATLAGGGQPVQQPSSPDAGMLQQGSVIQKFSTVPKQGQSLESFRQQIESRPRSTRPTVARKKKKVVSPGDRMFSKVQEITPAQNNTESHQVEVTEIPEKVVEAAKSEETKKQEIESPATSEKSAATSPVDVAAPQIVDRQSVTQYTEPPVTIQRQIEMPLVEKQAEEGIEGPGEEPAEQVQESMPAFEVPVQAVKPEEVSEVPQKSTLTPAITAPPVHKALPVEELPEQKSAIKKEMPVRKPKAAIKQAAVKQAPPVVQSTVQREEGAPVQRQPSFSLKAPLAKAVSAVRVVEQAKAEGKNKAEKTQPESVEAVSPSVDLPTKADAPEMPVVEQKQNDYDEQVVEDSVKNTEPFVPNPAEEEAGREMPLRQKLAERRQAAVNAVRRAVPVKLKQVQKPLLTHFAGPMIRAQKNRDNVVARAKTEMPAVRQDQSAFRPGGPQSISSEISTPQVDIQSFANDDKESEQALLEMPIAIREAVLPQVRIPEKQETKTQLKHRPAQKLPAAPVILRAANVVQRQWEEHSGVERQGSGGASSQGSEDDGNSSSLDLEALAEDVFPYVKRILEIESNRISGNFR